MYMTVGFGHLTLILLPHYLAKCRSRSFIVYNNEFILASSCISSNQGQNQWDVVPQLHFDTCAAFWHSLRIRSRVFRFSAGQFPHHIAPKTKDTVALLDQETPDFIPPALWPS